MCVCHALPQDWQEIAAWMENLDCGITYKGEGLAGACYKALVTPVSYTHLTLPTILRV